MYLLDTLSDISFYRVGLVFKSAVNIICIGVPILVMIFCMFDIFNIVYKPTTDETKIQIKKAVDRIIAGLIVFIIPSIINYSMSLINSYQKDTIFKYYEGASKAKIEQLRVKYEQEQKAERNKKEAEYKEAGKRIQNEEAKMKQQKEEIFKEWQEKKKASENNNNGNNNGDSGNNNDNNNSGDGGNNNGGYNPGNSGNDDGTSYSGDSNANGSFGGVTVSNGVFTIPNRRATSDADTPKQSGPSGVNPIFGERLTKFIQAAKQAGYKITITSGWRSYSSQRRLWDNSSRPCSSRSKWVACPGGSRHGFGIAADLKFNGSSCGGSWDCNAAAKWAHANAGKFGLKFRMSWEPWHIEPAQVKGGSFGSCNAKC